MAERRARHKEGARMSFHCSNVPRTPYLGSELLFARRDATRNHIYSLVATLAYQIIIRLPAVKETIVGVIESNPLIFDQALETQISELIIKPLWKLQLATIGTLPKVVIIVDAIDECVNSPVSQVNIIRTFAKYLSTCEAPIIVVFGSHSHSHLKEAFGQRRSQTCSSTSR